MLLTVKYQKSGHPTRALALLCICCTLLLANWAAPMLTKRSGSVIGSARQPAAAPLSIPANEICAAVAYKVLREQGYSEVYVCYSEKHQRMIVPVPVTDVRKKAPFA